MSTKNPRLNVTLSPETSEALEFLARLRSRSLSGIAQDLIEDALEMQEDLALSYLAKKRDVAGAKTVPHDDAWL